MLLAISQSKNCATDPCYPGVQCFPLGPSNRVCGACPPGMTGDGASCTSLLNVIQDQSDSDSENKQEPNMLTDQVCSQHYFFVEFQGKK